MRGSSVPDRPMDGRSRCKTASDADARRRAPGHEDIHSSQQVVFRNHIVELEFIKQLPVVTILPPPSSPKLLLIYFSRNQCAPPQSSTFSTTSARPAVNNLRW